MIKMKKLNPPIPSGVGGDGFYLYSFISCCPVMAR